MSFESTILVEARQQLEPDDLPALTHMEVQQSYIDGTLDQETFSTLATQATSEAADDMLSFFTNAPQKLDQIKALGTISGLDTSVIPRTTHLPISLNEHLLAAFVAAGRIDEAADCFTPDLYFGSHAARPLLSSQTATLEQKIRFSGIAKVRAIDRVMNDPHYGIYALEDWASVFASSGLVRPSQAMANHLIGKPALPKDFDRHEEYARIRRLQARHTAMRGEWALSSLTLQNSGGQIDDPELAQQIVDTQRALFNIDDVESRLFISARMGVHALTMDMNDEAEEFISTAIETMPSEFTSRIGVLGLANVAVFSAYCGEIDQAKQDLKFAITTARKTVPAERERLHETGIAYPEDGNEVVRTEVLRHPFVAYCLSDVANFNSQEVPFIASDMVKEGYTREAFEFVTRGGMLSTREKLYPVMTALNQRTLGAVQARSNEVIANCT